MKKPGLLLGALVGGLLTLPLLAIQFIGEQIAGFPFIPFTVFAVVRDRTPGGVITFFIERMVALIGALNLGRTDTAAKGIEESMGVIMLIVIGIVAGAIFFAVMRRVEERQDWLPGVLYGLIVGGVLTSTLFVGAQVYSADPLTSVIWTMGLFLIWGYAHNWAYNRLTYPLSRPVTSTQNVTVQQIDRRQFLISVGGSAAAITVVGALVGRFISDANQPETVDLNPAPSATEPPGLPNSSADVQPAPGTRPELTPVAEHYRIDIALVPPSIDLASWTLPFTVTDSSGNTTKLAELTMNDIKKLKPLEQYITQGCISNEIAGDLISTVKWTGSSAQDVLALVKLPPDATHLKIWGADGFYETVALDLIKQDPTIMFAYNWADQPLATEHGFPLRIHISDCYGMKQPKWITAIEVLNHDEDGYWVERSWDKDAFVRTVSVIDTVAKNATTTENGQQVIPIGGIAWGGARSISKVEVSIDDGNWVQTQLRTPLSHKTWVIWRYDWAFTSGNHTFAVRAYDGTGQLQITDDAPPHPSGATGIHKVQATI